MINRKRVSIATVIVAGFALAAFSMANGVAGQSAKTKDPLMNGLIHWWQFNLDGVDSIGNLSTNPIGPVTYMEVGNGHAIVFDGNDSGISLPPAKDMQFQGSFSISVWANLFSRPPGGHMWSSIIFDGDDRSGWDPYALQADPKGDIHFLVTGLHDELSEIQAPMPLNTFVYLTAVYDKGLGMQSLYMNGKLVNQVVGRPGQTPVCTLIERENAGIGIGTGNSFQTSRYHFGWKGAISDLRIYNRALSAIEAQSLYRLGIVRAIRPPSTTINPLR